MKEIPILFSTPMVEALLKDSKTMTRRIVKEKVKSSWVIGSKHYPDIDLKTCPYGMPGDVLWVRETFSEYKDLIIHKAQTFNTNEWYEVEGTKIDYKNIKWKPSLFMPKKYCRLFLSIKSINVERLHDISEEDALAEGIEVVKNQPFDDLESYKDYLDPERLLPFAKESFKTLWKKINGADSWNENPWVWVISFERIKP